MNVIQKARAGFSSITIRGGRITMWKGQAGSYAPHVGTVMMGASSSALALGVALAGGLLAPAAAWAGTCDEAVPGSGEFLCSGPAGADVTQSPTAPAGSPIVVTTEPGFGLDVGAGNAIGIIADAGNTGVSITDLNNSTIIGQLNGIFVRNDNTGNVNIVTTGQVTGLVNSGIRAGAGFGNTDVIVAAADTSGGQYGIFAANLGSGQLSVSSSGLASGASVAGISANLDEYGTNLSIAAADTRGGFYGIVAQMRGSGELSITSIGEAVGTSSYSFGIYARNGYGTDLTINAVDTSGGYAGIQTRNYGSGDLTITSSGTATGTAPSSNGISARNFGQNLAIEANNTSGSNAGIGALNYGTGALTITASGTVTGTGAGSYGIRARNYGTEMTIEVDL